jgi:hypothetical protein
VQYHLSQKSISLQYVVAADCRLPTACRLPKPKSIHSTFSSCVLRQRPRHAEQDANDERMSLASLGNRGSGAVAAGRPAASLARSTMLLLAMVECYYYGNGIVEHGLILNSHAPSDPSTAGEIADNHVVVPCVDSTAT